MLRAIVMRKYLKTIVRAMDRLERQDIYATLAEFVESEKNPIGLPEKLKRALTGGPSASPRWSLSWQIMRKVVPRKPDFREHHRTRDGARSPLPRPSSAATAHAGVSLLWFPPGIPPSLRLIAAGRRPSGWGEGRSLHSPRVLPELTGAAAGGCAVDDEFDFSKYCELILVRDIVNSVNIAGPIWGVMAFIGFLTCISHINFSADDPLALEPPPPVIPASGLCNAFQKTTLFTPGEAKAAAAVFGDMNAPVSGTNPVKGVVVFTQDSTADDVQVRWDLRWTENTPSTPAAGGMGWHVHERWANDVSTVTATRCGPTATGGHYVPQCDSTLECASCTRPMADRSGELSARIGNIDALTDLEMDGADGNIGFCGPGCRAGMAAEGWTHRAISAALDPVLQLSGTQSIVGRSIVIHDGRPPSPAPRIACATILPAQVVAKRGWPEHCTPPAPTGEPANIQAYAAFPEAGGVGPGVIEFLETEIDHATLGTSHATMITMTMAALPANVGGWHIHELPVGADCGSTGGHYDPDCFGASDTAGGWAGIGELTHRHGQLTPAMAGVEQSWLDSNLPLRGDRSIIGRSVVIHSTDVDSPRIACATIEGGGAPGGRRRLSNGTAAPAARARPVLRAPTPAYVNASRAQAGRPAPAPARRRLAGDTATTMDPSRAMGYVAYMIVTAFVTTVALHVILHMLQKDMKMQLVRRGWNSDEEVALRKCIDDIVGSNTASVPGGFDGDVEHNDGGHGDGKAGGHGHGRGKCGLNGYTTREKVLNFITDTLIVINCFYSSFCVLYIFYVTFWTGLGGFVAFLLNIFLLLPAVYQFFFLGPSIAGLRAMLAAFIHLDAELLREVEVYTSRTEEIKTALCEKVLQVLETRGGAQADVSSMSAEERATKAAEYFFEYDVDGGADGHLGRDELEKALNSLKVCITHKEIKQLVRDLDTSQNGEVELEELRAFLLQAPARVGSASGRGSMQSAPAVAARPAGLGQSSVGGADPELLRELAVLQDENAQLRARGGAAGGGGGGGDDPEVLAEMEAMMQEIQHLKQDKQRLTKRMKEMSAPSATAPAAGRRAAPSLGARSRSGRARTPTRAGAKKAPPPLPAKGTVFAQYDADGSGSLEMGEVRTLLRARGIATTGAAFESILQKYDKDGDGSISQVEFDDLYAHLAAQAPKMAPRAARRSAGGNTSRI